MVKFEGRTQEKILETRRREVLKHINDSIDDAMVSITNLFGIKGVCDALHIDSNIESIVEECLKNARANHNKLLKLSETLSRNWGFIK